MVTTILTILIPLAGTLIGSIAGITSNDQIAGKILYDENIN